MRNKDKRKKKSKQSSPRPVSRGYSIERNDFPTNRPMPNGSASTTDDYGFLDSSRQYTKKEVSNGSSRTRKNERNLSSTRVEQAGQHILQNRSFAQPTTNSRNRSHRDEQLEFYPKQAVERRSRSVSRNPSNAEHDSSTNRSRQDRSRSKSRDIVALYTSTNPKQRCRSATPVGSLRSYIYVPPSNEYNMTRPKSRASTNYDDDFQSISLNDTLPSDQYRRSRSLVREQTDRDSTLKSTTSSYYSRRARSETRNSSMTRDAISLCSNLSTQSRALSNSEIASQNLELWMSTTSKNQRQSSKNRKSKQNDTKEKFVTLLEMDAMVNEKLEKLLDNANSVKPANVKMMAIAGHTPSESWESKDELKVEPGELITGLYKQNEWLYVSKKDSQSGYVPYAYTKAIKLTPLDKSSPQRPDKSKPIETNTSNLAAEVHCPAHNHSKPEWTSSPKHFSKTNFIPDPTYYSGVYTAKPFDQERDSLSSTNSAFLEEIMCARPSGVPRHLRQQTQFADCLVVDTDSKSDGLIEEDIRVCSDSGISEPNSNHSDEIDPYVSLANNRLPQYNNLVTPGSRSSLESSNPQEDCRARRMYKHFSRSNQESMTNHNQPFPAQINTMPFGLLGERLQHTPLPPHQSMLPQFHQEFAHEQPIYCNISQDMRDRAQPGLESSSTTKPIIPKDYNGPRARVVYDYMGENEDDVVVMAGDVVTVLNAEDIEWIWVMRRDGVEGFMPREFVLSTELDRPRERIVMQRQMLVTL